MITIDKLENSLVEVRRYIKAAEAAKKVLRTEPNYACGKQTGAARRASLDLTRALSALRARDA